MSSRDDEPRRIVHIGPGSDPDDWHDDAPPSFLIEDARERVRIDEERRKEGAQLARRLLAAFVIVVLMAVGFHVVLPAFGMRLPPLVPVLCYAAIATAAILTSRDQPTGMT